MSNQLRPILPNPLAQTNPPSSSKPENGFIANWDPRKRKQTTVACSPCRYKRAKCDGSRPQCQRCRVANLDCSYETLYASETRWSAFRRENASLRQSSSNLTQLFLRLSQLPEPEAQRLLQHMRSSSTPELALVSIQSTKDVDSLLQQMSIGSGVDAITHQPSLDWTVHHPMAHIEVTPLLVHRMLQSLVSHSTSALNLNGITATIDPQLLASGSARCTPSGIASRGTVRSCPTPRHIPSVASEGYDGQLLASVRARLSKVDFRLWTRVPVENSEATEAILLYLVNEHCVCSVFDVEAMLGDMETQGADHCSSFFVNALLALTLQGYTSRRPKAARESCLFESEANRLSQSNPRDSLASVAGWSLLYLSLTYHNKCDAARVCIGKFVDMAKRMRLLGLQTALRAADLDRMSEKMQHAYAVTAWGVFNILTMQAFMHVVDPIELRPQLPVSPEPISTQPQIGFTAPDSLMGATRIAFCSLFRVIAEVSWTRRGRQADVSAEPKFVSHQHQQLLNLLSSLPSFMKSRGDNPPYTMVFYMWFHVAILDLFRPLIAGSRGSEASSPTLYREIFAASIEQLKRLILVFVDQYESASFTTHWVVAPLYVANAVLRDTSDPTWRLYFNVIIHAYRKYRAIHPSLQIMEDMLRGILAMAVEVGALTESEALALNSGGYAKQTVSNLPVRKRDTDLRGFVVDLDLALLGGDAANVDPLLDKFEEMVMFEELTNRTCY